MSNKVVSNENQLLEQQSTNTKLDTLNTNGAKESKQDTQITALNTIATNTNGLGLGTTATNTSVSQSATSVSILASNVNRKNAIIRNDANQDLYLHLGATATTNSTIKLMKGDMWIETSASVITGIWAGAGAGAARITEVV